MTPLFVAISFAGGALATLSVLQLVRPVIGGRFVLPALAAAVLTTALTTTLGVAGGVARLDFLLGLCAFTPPVLVLLEAAAIALGASTRARWLLMLAWGLIVFPAATLLPLVLTAPCRFTGCGIADFGGALALFVSASAFVLPAWARPGDALTVEVRGGQAVAGLVGFWLAFVVWLVSLEAAFDHYLLRILLAAVVGPVAAALGWWLVDLLRAVGRAPVRSLAFGFLAGAAATVSGAVTVSFPWTAVVAALAGMLGALLHSLPRLAALGLAPRWGMTLLGATAMGFLAPPVWGDAMGVLFSAQVGVLLTPLAAFFAVALGSALVSLPIWLAIRRRPPAAA